MAEPTRPVVRFYGYGYARVANRELNVTIDGRQALHEGPRRVGHCVYCKGHCIGAHLHCDSRVYKEARRAP